MVAAMLILNQHVTITNRESKIEEGVRVQLETDYRDKKNCRNRLYPSTHIR